ncbi:NAD-dependent protein deacylase sirtuin-5, mitochondrial [Carnimonas sp. R-84981]|uniref:SIR2 family NAD-dependent protein deacylase n=1 Tax=Carnimonas bestiolae TaxID=3402172 RepID=UPI003EDC0D3E
MRHLVVLSGAGISAESGLELYRASDGLWAQHRVEDVATPQGWQRDPEQVLAFYRERRRAIQQAEPNAAHRALAALERDGFRVSILTQNIDDLHERAGSSEVLHLHGSALEACASDNPEQRYPLNANGDIQLGDLCPRGSQLRPHVVWFGEPVKYLEQAVDLVASAHLLLVVGTSLEVMPVAGLIEHTALDVPRVLVDPNAHTVAPRGVKPIAAAATRGVPYLVEHWRHVGQLSVPIQPLPCNSDA